MNFVSFSIILLTELQLTQLNHIEIMIRLMNQKRENARDVQIQTEGDTTESRQGPFMVSKATTVDNNTVEAKRERIEQVIKQTELMTEKKPITFLPQGNDGTTTEYIFISLIFYI